MRAEQEEIFVKRAGERAIDPEVAKAIFEQMAYFAGYGFNKSHSAAYAVIAFRTAYLKTHYPVEYSPGLLGRHLILVDVPTGLEGLGNSPLGYLVEHHP